MSSSPGQAVLNGRYELRRRLARGGMADVFLAHDTLLDRSVAVKVLFPQYASDPAFVERFRREAQAAANLSHPSIVSVYDGGQAGGTNYIVMEFVEGHSLAQLLRANGPMPAGPAADVAADVAAALGHSHRNGVVHRDVKPGNILISSGGAVKVTDFGIARAFSGTQENLTQTGAVMGTATYFSPEQAQGQSVDQRSDLYSLGVVLYEMVVGRPPFAGDGPVAIAYKHVQEAPTPPREINPAIPVALEQIIMRCLAKSPGQRYATADELRGDLRRFRQGETPMAAAAPIAPTQAMSATRVLPEQATTYGPAAGRPEGRGTGYLVLFLVCILALVGMLFALARSLGIGDPSGPTTVTVPSVIQYPVDQARQELIRAGFLVVNEDEASADIAEGLVIRTDPGAEAQAEKGSTVTLFVSTGPGTVQVPNVQQLAVDAARKQLDDLGLVVQTRQRETEDIAEGIVIDQTPDVGTEVAPGDTVTLTVSTGSNKVVVPDVAGDTSASARKRLESNGFVVRQVDQASDSADEDTVIATNPAGGQKATRGSTVTMTVSSGKTKVTVPDVVGRLAADAKAQLQALGLQVQTVTQNVAPSECADGEVTNQNPEAGSSVDKGSTVQLTVGKSVFVPPECD